LIFVARLIWKIKGIDYLIEILDKIFTKNDAWQIDVVGDGEAFAEMTSVIHEKPWSRQVCFHGNIGDVISRYLEADILLLTSRFEGFGLVVTEAMECGLPVVSFKTAGPSEIITDGINGYLIDKYDTDAFANAVLELMHNDDLRLAMGKNAALRAGDFDIEVIKKQWDEIL
jgi:glycosyltransferase involved in cell wall biosynthesis